MGRSSNQDALRTRQRILETASDLFRTKGADHVSVADIMAALGMTTGAFYRHFASKDAILSETYRLAFDRVVLQWQDRASHGTGEDDGGRQALLGHYLRDDPQGRCPMIAFAEDAARAPAQADVRKAYCDGAGSLFRVFMDASGPSADADAQAMLLFAAMVGARRLEEATGNAPWAKQIRQAVLDAAHAR